jgi:hypothetical protein
MEVYHLDEDGAPRLLMWMPARPLAAVRPLRSSTDDLQARVRAALRTNLLRLGSLRPRRGPRRPSAEGELRILPDFGL